VDVEVDHERFAGVRAALVRIDSPARNPGVVVQGDVCEAVAE
jgi:hypothetical protein